jgi:hypothetical protein
MRVYTLPYPQDLLDKKGALVWLESAFLGLIRFWPILARSGREPLWPAMDKASGRLEWCSGTGWWYRYRARHHPLPLRWVISRDPAGERETRLYFSTDPALSGLDILLAFVNRWSRDVTFEESRAHLGIETQRQWSDPAIERSTPCLFALYSFVTLLGRLLHPKGDIPVLQTAWYHKKHATFSDVLVTVRFSLWDPFRYPTLPENPDVILLPRSEVSRLLAAACSSP